MRQALKSGLSLILTGIVLGSTFLTGCKKEQGPTQQDNIAMWAKIDEKKENPSEKKSIENSKPVRSSVFYINETEKLEAFERYTLRLQSRLRATKERLMQSVHAGPKTTIKTEDSKRGITSYPQEIYVFFSEKVNKSPIKFLDVANPAPLQDKRKIEEILKEIKKNSSRKASFDKDQTDAYVFTNEELRRVTPEKGYLTLESCGESAVNFTRKTEISHPELYVATYSRLKTIDKSGEERIFVAVAQGKAYPPYLPDFEGYWLDPSTDKIFCMSAEKLFTKRRGYNIIEEDFSETATLFKKNIIYLDENKKGSLKYEKDNKGKRVFYIDSNGRENSLRQITAEEARIQ